MNPTIFLGELKRRNVYEVAGAYAIVGWPSIQVATQVFSFLEIPNWAVRLACAMIRLTRTSLPKSIYLQHHER
jgi:hypothetical protein